MSAPSRLRWRVSHREASDPSGCSAASQLGVPVQTPATGGKQVYRATRIAVKQCEPGLGKQGKLSVNYYSNTALAFIHQALIAIKKEWMPSDKCGRSRWGGHQNRQVAVTASLVGKGGVG